MYGFAKPTGSADPLDVAIRETLTKAFPDHDEEYVNQVALEVREAAKVAGYIRTSIEMQYWKDPDFFHEPYHGTFLRERTFEVDGITSTTRV